jgi:outer membrane lipoprotein SlyB
MQYHADSRQEYTDGVGTGPVAVGAVLGAIAGAVLGAYVQKRWPSDPTDEE